MSRISLLSLLIIAIFISTTLASPRRYRREADKKENSRCNNEQLEKVMLENIGDDVKQSKLKVMEEAEKKIGGTFNVICAHGDFSYITSTRIYCLTGNESVKCYAFLAESSRAAEEDQPS